MATERQIEANRRNAQRSTGPRTAEGKAASRFNALNHGLRAQQLALPHEDAEQVQAFVDALIEAVAPRDAMEAELACEIATLSWKLRRAERYEHAVLSKRMYARIDAIGGPDPEETAWDYEIAAFDDDEDGRRRRRYITGLRNSLGRARRELRLWQESHPESAPEVQEDQGDDAEIGFVRQDGGRVGCGAPTGRERPAGLRTDEGGGRSPLPLPPAPRYEADAPVGAEPRVPSVRVAPHPTTGALL